VILQPIQPKVEHVLRRLHDLEQGARRLVDAHIGRLRGQRYRHQQLIGVAEFQLRLRVGVALGQAAEEFEDVGFFMGRGLEEGREDARAIALALPLMSSVRAGFGSRASAAGIKTHTQRYRNKACGAAMLALPAFSATSPK
jgi:hypothetical protein